MIGSWNFRLQVMQNRASSQVDCVCVCISSFDDIIIVNYSISFVVMPVISDDSIFSDSSDGSVSSDCSAFSVFSDNCFQ